MISKQVPHTYIQHGTRFFALFVYVQETFKQADVEKVVDSHNFYIFSEETPLTIPSIYAWVCLACFVPCQKRVVKKYIEDQKNV